MDIVETTCTVLPASAGMIHEKQDTQKLDYGAPRIRGDDPTLMSHQDDGYVCSPHPRG